MTNLYRSREVAPKKPWHQRLNDLLFRSYGRKVTPDTTLAMLEQHFSEKGLQEVVQLKSLHRIALYWSSPTQEVIDTLNSIQFDERRSRNRTVEGEMRLSLTQSDDADLKLISKLSKLRTLGINESPKVTDAGIKYLSNSKNLRPVF